MLSTFNNFAGYTEIPQLFCCFSHVEKNFNNFISLRNSIEFPPVNRFDWLSCECEVKWNEMKLRITLKRVFLYICFVLYCLYCFWTLFFLSILSLTKKNFSCFICFYTSAAERKCFCSLQMVHCTWIGYFGGKGRRVLKSWGVAGLGQKSCQRFISLLKQTMWSGRRRKIGLHMAIVAVE